MYKHFFKRLIDFFVSFVGMLFLLLPMFIIAIAIKCDSKGPVFFKQKRVGKNKKLFNILKFIRLEEVGWLHLVAPPFRRQAYHFAIFGNYA